MTEKRCTRTRMLNTLVLLLLLVRRVEEDLAGRCGTRERWVLTIVRAHGRETAEDGVVQLEFEGGNQHGGPCPLGRRSSRLPLAHQRRKEANTGAVSPASRYET